MSISTQSFEKGIDLTAVIKVQGSHFVQLVDQAQPSAGKGLVVSSSDTALDTPEVPNPDVEYEGATPVWWKNSVWKRILWASAGVKVYIWNDALASDPTYLKWEVLGEDAAEALALAQQAIVDAGAAADAASAAHSVATNAEAIAVDAQTTAEGAEATANAVAAQLNALAGLLPTGFILPAAYQASFDITQNQGWLLCDGSAVSRVTFAALFAKIGVAWGAGDGTNTFNLPDLRGRVVAGNGTGSGLSARTLGNSGVVGAESHQLVAAETPTHEHLIANTDLGPDSPGTTLTADNHLNAERDNKYALSGSATTPTLGKTTPFGGGQAHNNMQPTAFCPWYIKT